MSYINKILTLFLIGLSFSLSAQVTVKLDEKSVFLDEKSIWSSEFFDVEIIFENEELLYILQTNHYLNEKLFIVDKSDYSILKYVERPFKAPESYDKVISYGNLNDSLFFAIRREEYEGHQQIVLKYMDENWWEGDHEEIIMDNHAMADEDISLSLNIQSGGDFILASELYTDERGLKKETLFIFDKHRNKVFEKHFEPSERYEMNIHSTGGAFFLGHHFLMSYAQVDQKGNLYYLGWNSLIIHRVDDGFERYVYHFPENSLGTGYSMRNTSIHLSDGQFFANAEIIHTREVAVENEFQESKVERELVGFYSMVISTEDFDISSEALHFYDDQETISRGYILQEGDTLPTRSAEINSKLMSKDLYVRHTPSETIQLADGSYLRISEKTSASYGDWITNGILINKFSKDGTHLWTQVIEKAGSISLLQNTFSRNPIEYFRNANSFQFYQEDSLIYFMYNEPPAIDDEEYDSESVVTDYNMRTAVDIDYCKFYISTLNTKTGEVQTTDHPVYFKDEMVFLPFGKDDSRSNGNHFLIGTPDNSIMEVTSFELIRN